VTNKSVYHGISSRWVYYTAIVMILQLFTIELSTEYYFTVDVDLLVLCSSLTVLRVCSVSSCCSVIDSNSHRHC
jgi:hypothetical protein